MSQSFTYDVLIIGSGAAGLTLGLSLPEHIKAAIISKDSLDAGSTRWAAWRSSRRLRSRARCGAGSTPSPRTTHAIE